MLLQLSLEALYAIDDRRPLEAFFEPRLIDGHERLPLFIGALPQLGKLYQQFGITVGLPKHMRSHLHFLQVNPLKRLFFGSIGYGRVVELRPIALSSIFEPELYLILLLEAQSGGGSMLHPPSRQPINHHFQLGESSTAGLLQQEITVAQPHRYHVMRHFTIKFMVGYAALIIIHVKASLYCCLAQGTPLHRVSATVATTEHHRSNAQRTNQSAR